MSNTFFLKTVGTTTCKISRLPLESSQTRYNISSMQRRLSHWAHNVLVFSPQCEMSFHSGLARFSSSPLIMKVISSP